VQQPSENRWCALRRWRGRIPRGCLYRRRVPGDHPLRVRGRHTRGCKALVHCSHRRQPLVLGRQLAGAAWYRDDKLQWDPGPGRATTWNWTSVTSGGYHTCAIRRDGTLWCWGGQCSGTAWQRDDRQHADTITSSGQDWVMVRLACSIPAACSRMESVGWGTMRMVVWAMARRTTAWCL